MQPSSRVLIRAVRDAGGHAALLGAACLAGAAAELLLPVTLGRAVDALLGTADPGAAPGLGGSAAGWPAAAVTLIAVAASTEILGELAGGTGTARATARLRHRLLRRVFAMPHRTAARYPVGDLVARLASQSADAGSAVAAVVGGAFSAVPAVGSLVALTLLDPWLGAAFVLGLLLLGLLLRGFAVDASAAARGYQRVQGAIAGHLVEALDGSRTIAAAGTVDREIRRVLRLRPQLSAHGTGTWAALATAAGRTALVAPLTQIAVIAAGGVLLAEGRLTPGELLAATQYAALGAGLGAVLATLNHLVRARSGAGRAAEVLAETAARYGTRPLPAGPGELRFERVTVREGDRTVLDDVDLSVPGGATLAVVGRSGSGKSTLAEVAGRLRDPDVGRVLLDGVPLGDCAAEALGDAVGYGFERPTLVGATVGDAIAVGRPGGEATAISAAAVAAVDGYIGRLPGGYRTPLADAPMSGGEAQRLGLARALYGGGRLLVLDDAASSLDSVTEARITAALTRHTAGRTRLVVTHRRATAARADLVAWLDGGRLRAVAPHRTLWADPDYRATFAASAASGAPATSDASAASAASAASGAPATSDASTASAAASGVER
ncbi:ABC transporter ATP-binding protein/permease [Actinoplanes sp. KI2]|uniref:ABC transporter ATP-binding protein n=1 Tax=Actinoplanes sp. KI2 TaxID=2983315 RepID=UPI0021D613D4|nr:ABC transporter ATP-binding protein [Actinoplanes sp. KI2]MCU7727472.1 ABC transporter ATP-binding protein/permease [Actinoplanes sp. KI2]